MKYKVCVVTATRAEYGLLRPLLFRLKNNKSVQLHLIVTGTHLNERFGNTQKEIETDGFYDFQRVIIPLDDDSKLGMAESTGVATERLALALDKLQPQIVVILGDRYEMLGAATAAHLLGIPVVHLCGGDVTEGAVDDAIRHCITKLSSLHFAGCEQSAKRIIQMGEEPQRVFNVGEPGVENCLKTDFLDREQLSESIGFSSIRNDYSVVTFHPVTMENNTGVEQVQNLIKAMDTFPNMAYIITMANADAGGRAINDLWIKEGQKRQNWLVVASLGVRRYLSAVKYAKLVIGNSSSGIVEAPSLGVPTINIGDRQKGRMMAESVIWCAPQKDEIVSAMRCALQPEFQKKAKHVHSPFGDGSTSKQIEERIIEFLKNKGDTNEKHFYDIEFSV